MFKPDKLPQHNARIHQHHRTTIRARYSVLRENNDAHQACTILSTEYGFGLDAIRRYVSMRSETRICGDCWLEYIHDRRDNAHTCPKCRKEREFLASICKAGIPSHKTRTKKSKFYKTIRTFNRTLRMLQKEYGMTRMEGIRMISDVKDGLHKHRRNDVILEMDE